MTNLYFYEIYLPCEPKEPIFTGLAISDKKAREVKEIVDQQLIIPWWLDKPKVEQSPEAYTLKQITVEEATSKLLELQTKNSADLEELTNKNFNLVTEICKKSHFLNKLTYAFNSINQ